MQATAIIHRDFSVAEVDARIYGAHLGGAGSADHAAVFDADPTEEGGLRTDVLDLASAYRLSCVHGPGIHQGAGRGPLDREIRVDGLVAWCLRSGPEPMLAIGGGSAADRRRVIGLGERHGVRLWHLGALDEECGLGDLAVRVRTRDPSAVLVLDAGRDGAALGALRGSPVAPDLVSLAPDDGGPGGAPASRRLDRAIAALSDRLSRAGVTGPGGRPIGIQVDRWGLAPLGGPRAAADALDRAMALNVLIRRADRVRAAFAANVFAGLSGALSPRIGMGHAASLFDPLLAGSVYGRGVSLMPVVRGPVTETGDGEAVQALDLSAVHDEQAGTLALFFANAAGVALDAEVELHGFASLAVAEHRLADPRPRLPGTRPPAPIVTGGRLRWRVPSGSYGVVRLAPVRN